MMSNDFEEAFGSFLERKEYDEAESALFAMVRRAGTKAAGKVRLFGRDGVEIPAGTAFYAGGLEFQLAADAVIRDGSAAGYLQAGAVGQKYNVPAGSINQILRNIPGLERFECGEKIGRAHV